MRISPITFFWAVAIPYVGVNMQKVLVCLGTAAIIVGLLWPWLGKIPLGRLPGDLVIDKPDFKVYIPVTTMILVSVLISVLLWIFKR